MAARDLRFGAGTGASSPTGGAAAGLGAALAARDLRVGADTVAAVAVLAVAGSASRRLTRGRDDDSKSNTDVDGAVCLGTACLPIGYGEASRCTT